jgi:hypothetical protein
VNDCRRLQLPDRGVYGVAVQKIDWLPPRE